MALVIMYAVLSHFDFVAKFTVKKFFIKSDFSLKDGFPKAPSLGKLANFPVFYWERPLPYHLVYKTWRY